jgi:hypothetical protein
MNLWAAFIVRAQSPRAHDEYFDLIAQYFNFSFGETSSPDPTLRLDVDPFGCLKHQRKHGWIVHANYHSGQRRPIVELVGVEGVGHHAVHSMFDRPDKKEDYFKFTGSSWPATSKWRQDECPLEANIRARPLHVFGTPEKPGDRPDMYVVLVRAPGASAMSAMVRFDHVGKATDLGSQTLAQGDVLRRLRLQRDSQFESMAVLSTYVRSLPCDRTIVVPLEVRRRAPRSRCLFGMTMPVFCILFYDSLGSFSVSSPCCLSTCRRSDAPTSFWCQQRKNPGASD